MALHMTDDQDSGEDWVDSGSSGNRGGGGGGFSGGGLLNFLPLLLGLFGRRGGGGNSGGKGGCGGGGLILVIVAVAAYFLFFKGGCNLFQGGEGGGGSITDLFSQTGYNFNPNETKKAPVYEGLEDDNTKNPLPESVSLLAFAPERQNQGKQGSCVAWSSGYAARTILEAASTRQNPNTLAYSPAFLYNNIALEDCQGSYIQRAMEFMSSRGAVPYSDFSYDENDCSRQANANLFQKAETGKIHGFHRLTESDDVNGLNIRAIKEHLAKDAPVVIGMMVGGSFMQPMMGQKVWEPTASDGDMRGFGGHAMCVIGYDDRLQGGAFQIMNSWGKEWGQDGVGWVRYGDFKEYVREAYGLDPLQKRGEALTIPFETTVGLYNPDSRNGIALRPAGDNVFRTASPIAKQSRFKIEIKNEVECYIYIFTPDLQQKSIVLFPYKPIHSAYCGITGYRLFPRKESITADEVGNRDFMAVVVSRKELDYNKVNEAINGASGATYSEKVNAALGGQAARSATFGTAGAGAMLLKSDNAPDNLMFAIVEIDKQ